MTVVADVAVVEIGPPRAKGNIRQRTQPFAPPIHNDNNAFKDATRYPWTAC
jgi:hypothetical protein